MPIYNYIPVPGHGKRLLPIVINPEAKDLEWLKSVSERTGFTFPGMTGLVIGGDLYMFPACGYPTRYMIEALVRDSRTWWETIEELDWFRLTFMPSGPFMELKGGLQKKLTTKGGRRVSRVIRHFRPQIYETQRY